MVLLFERILCPIDTMDFSWATLKTGKRLFPRFETGSACGSENHAACSKGEDLHEDQHGKISPYF